MRDSFFLDTNGWLVILLTSSLASYASYTDKSWGLVDCCSFIVMQDYGITDAFTSDRHFEQAGFNCLLKS